MPKSKRKAKHCEIPRRDSGSASDADSSMSSGEGEVQDPIEGLSLQIEAAQGSSGGTDLEAGGSSMKGNEDEDFADGADAEATAIRQEISNMSFEEIQQLKEKLGTKLYNTVMTKQKAERRREAVLKRANKNRPREVTAKRPVSVLRNVFEVKKKVSRDPRFDDLSGEFNEAIFKQTYKFLGDIRSKEKEELKKELANEVDEERKEKIKNLLKRIANQENAKKKEAEIVKKKKELGQQLIERAKEGKKPYFLKKSEIRNLSLKEKYEQLKRSGKLDKYLERKRKKNASKDKRHLPKSSLQT